MRPPRIRFLFVVAGATCLMLTGCRSATSVPAVVVDGVTITEGALEHQLDLLLADPQIAQQVRSGGAEARRDLTRRLLTVMIERQLVEAFAASHDIFVPPSQINADLNQVIKSQGGKEQFERLLAQHGVTLQDVRANIRFNLVQGRVQDSVAQQRFGLNVTQQQSQQAFSDWLRDEVRRADVDVNPRFGRFDSETVRICPITSTADAVDCPAA